MVREFILGSNRTGLYVAGRVSPTTRAPTATLEGQIGDILRGAPPIYTGAYTTQGSVVAPAATIAAWDKFIATRWNTAPTPSSTNPS
jgi:carboxypeptidase D